MTYLYHAVPKNLQGSILYPLNALKDQLPDVYEQQVSKYIGRKHLTQQQIPILNCLWNDVLHFSAVNPKEIKQSLIEAGQNDFTGSYYQVDPRLIESKKAVVYLYAYTDSKDKINKENIVSYSPDEIVKFSIMPQETRNYYKNYYQEKIYKEERFLLYYKIPHILYKGTLGVTNLPIISV